MSAVNTVDISYVAVPGTAALPPEPIKLTAMEALWLPFPVLQHVLFYEVPGLPPFDSVVRSLRSSLGATLASFAPLAGKLVYLDDTGDVAIACFASDGVKFVAAESDADVRRLAGDKLHDLLTFEKLVPELDMSKLPTSMLAVQTTRLQGGLAVGVTVHHGVVDGNSLWMFVEAWAAACRAETPAAAPCFDRSAIRLHLVRDIHGDGALAAAASAIQEEIRKVAEHPLARWDFMSLTETLVAVRERVMNVSGSPGFRPYDVADFGWGKPRRTEPIRMNHDGQVALIRAKDGRGVQVSVSMLRSAHMDDFKSQLLELLG